MKALREKQTSHAQTIRGGIIIRRCPAEEIAFAYLFESTGLEFR